MEDIGGGTLDTGRVPNSDGDCPGLETGCDRAALQPRHARQRGVDTPGGFRS